MTNHKSQHDKRGIWSGKRQSLWSPETYSPGAVISASAALLCVTLLQYLSSRQAEVYSEIICWSLLSALLHITQSKDSLRTITPPNTIARQPISWRSSCVVALGITLATLYRAECNSIKLYVENAYSFVARIQANRVYSQS